MNKETAPDHQKLTQMDVHLTGDWTPEEAARILKVIQKLASQTGEQSLPTLFNHRPTTLHHSNRPGRVGHTRGEDIYLDNEWTDWTLAHELGHRWNITWGRKPELELRHATRAGKLEWLKRPLRLFEKWLERFLKRLGFKNRIDWQALWYDPGDAPPPCGVDRNFNASEDLAESFAAMIFPQDAKRRAAKAVGRLTKQSEHWNWGKQFTSFDQTPRGKITHQKIRRHSPPD